MANDFFHDRTHLIDFDGINDEVLGFIAILPGSLFKAIGNLLDTIIQYIWEAHQYRCLHVPQLQFIHQVPQVDGNPIFTRSDHHMPFLVDTKVRSPPTCNVIEFF